MAAARHSKAGEFVRRGIFAGLRDFAELERRIAALPDEQSRGAAFEVFVEAYLATQRRHDAAMVWPLAAVPTQTLQTLGLSAQDYGVDGVFQTKLGHFNAYQVMFRTGRPALTWRELSTFMGLADSPHIRSRVLLTNCDDLPPVLNERLGFFCIRGSDLDRMEADDFRALEAWLAHAAFVAPRKQPQPHQTEALAALLPALDTHDRVSAIMACGTGKTSLRSGLPKLWSAVTCHRFPVWRLVARQRRDKSRREKAPTSRHTPKFSSSCRRSPCCARRCTNGCAKRACPASRISASAPTPR